jgi:hypothetical protein
MALIFRCYIFFKKAVGSLLFIKKELQPKEYKILKPDRSGKDRKTMETQPREHQDQERTN